MESLELLANNVANAPTGGDNADREFYGLYTAAESDGASAMPLIEQPWTDLTQGLVHATDNPLDLAISGRGFFAVDGPNGPLYTRNGNFRLAKDGRLVTPDGLPVRGAGGAPIVLQPGRRVDIESDGTVQQDGLAVGRLEVVDFATLDGVAKQGSNYFRIADPSMKAVAASGAVEQGKLEASNTGSAESAVRLVSVMRQFEMLQKAVNLGGEMNRAAIEQVARVGN
jgi:flagellar basal-body rod protein FlgF